MAKKGGSDLALIFGPADGGGSKDSDSAMDDMAEGELAGDGGESDGDEEADAPPPDFALNAAEAFPDLAGDDARIDALYRTIKSCHPGI